MLVLKCEQGFVGYKSGTNCKLECNRANYEAIQVERGPTGLIHFKGMMMTSDRLTRPLVFKHFGNYRAEWSILADGIGRHIGRRWHTRRILSGIEGAVQVVHQEQRWILLDGWEERSFRCRNAAVQFGHSLGILKKPPLSHPNSPILCIHEIHFFLDQLHYSTRCFLKIIFIYYRFPSL